MYMPSRNNVVSIARISLTSVVVASCGSSKPREPDLPKQPDRWVRSISLDPDSEARYIGTTKDYLITTVGAFKDVNVPMTLSVGDEVEGVRIGAIKCSYHWRDASYGVEQYMWRGRWACQAGRSQEEVESAVADNGDKHFEYIHVRPVRLDIE
jgi:hypothetical protein